MTRQRSFLFAHGRLIGLLSAPLWAFAPGVSHAGPVGGQIVGGSGSISQPSSTLTEIHQNSDLLAIDWQQFDVGANEVVKYIQPSSSSIALNRILDSKQSLILGRIEANGRLFLVNPRGIIFGKGASVNVAGLVASSLDIDPRDFIDGHFEFNDKGGDGIVVNQGTIEAAVGGAVVLLGKVVINEGAIDAPRGSAQLVGAGGAVITFDDNEQLGIQITAAEAQKIAGQADAVRNSGTITAEGGYIALTGATTADIFTNAVNNEGVLVAQSVSSHDGVVELSGGAGRVAQSGTVDVSAQAGSGADGGRITISGGTVEHSGTLRADGANGGDIELHADDLVRTDGTAVISAKGESGKGGNVELLADRVGVMGNTRIDASGTNGGGVVHIGGSFHGANDGTGPGNAQRTAVDNGVSIYADATVNGNGGEVVVWSDDVTYFGGNIYARGGASGGDGGNVEVSGKQSLEFLGYVDTSAVNGTIGNLLLDPAVINIINGSGGADDSQIADGIINAGDNSGGTYQISEQALEALTSSVTLSATQAINIADLADNQLLFNPNGGTVTFNVNGTSGTSSFTMADTNDEIRVNNGSLAINVINSVSGVGASTAGAANIALGKLTTTSGSISVQGSSSANSSTTGATTGAVTISVGAIDAGTTVSVSGSTQAVSGPSSATGGAVTVTTGDITAGGNVAVTATSTASNSSGSSATGGNVAVTTGSINTGGTVTVTSSSDAAPAAVGTATGGTAAATVGSVVAGGAVTLGAASTASTGATGTQISKSTTVTAADISVTANAPIQITANSQNNTSLETVNVSGNYIDNGGNETINTYTLNLNGNTVFTTTGTVSLNYTVLNQNGYTLTQGPLTNIYIGDISGSAGAGELGFSQADITAFAGSGLVLSALDNIYIGNATIDSSSATSLQLIADSDSSGVGDISIASGKILDLNGRNLTASGANITINGSITNSGTGTQQFTSAGAITLGAGASLVSGSGNISLDAATGITMASTAAITSTSGQLALTAAGNIALGSLTTGNATTNAVRVTSTGGAITDAGTTTNITASAAGARVALTAANGITAGLSIADLLVSNSTSGAVSLTNDRALQISGITNTPATTTTITTTGAGSNMTVAGNIASGSDVALTSSGTFTVNDGVTINPTAGTIAINAAGNAAITGLTTANNTGSAVSVISGGAITDNGDTNTDISAAQPSAVITLQAASGIGTAINPIDINGQIAATNGASGDIALHTLGTYTFGAIDNSASSGGAVVLSSDGNLTVGNITTANGAIGLSAFDNVTLSAGAALQSSGGNVAITADTDTNGVGAITMGTGTIAAGGGTVTLSAAQDISLNQLTTTNTTTGAVAITSTAGQILGNFDGSADITATGAGSRVTLNAATGIGSGANPLELSVADLAATNTTSGAVDITNDRALQISGITNTPATTTTIATTGAGSNMTVAGNIASGSNVALTSSGAFTVNDGVTINPTAGTIAINAAGNAAITGLTTTNNTGSAISVISGGAITDSGDTNADAAATQPGATVTLQAANGIGNGNAIDFSGQIAATNGSSGDIGLHALGSYTFNAVDNSAAAGGAVNLSADGNLTAGSVTANNGAITLAATGDITLASGATLQSGGGNIDLTADNDNSGTGAITMGTGTIAAGSGMITLSAAQDVSLNRLTTTNTTTGAVAITSTAGRILGNFDGSADIVATGAGSRVTLNAAAGINSGASALELSVADLALTNTASGAVSISNERSLQVSAFANGGSGDAVIAVTGAGNDLIFAGTLQNGGGNATLSAARTIGLQAVANVNALSTSSATVNYSQSIAAGSITSNGTADVAGNLSATAGDIELQTVVLSGTAQAFTSSAGDINLGAVSGGGDLQLSSAGNTVLTSVALGTGNFSASSTGGGTFTANGAISAGAVALTQFSAADLQAVTADGTLDIAADTIGLYDNLQSTGAMTLTGTTQLRGDVTLATASSGVTALFAGAGSRARMLATSGSGAAIKLQGSLVGNGHSLTIDAGHDIVCIACTPGATASGLSALDIQSSIKTVLGPMSVSGDATIRADQEIYLNGDTTISGNLALLADANNDGIGIAGLLAGKNLSVGGTLTVQPIALSSIQTAALCETPTGLPQMPETTSPGTPATVVVSNTDMGFAMQQLASYEVASDDAALYNVPQIAYLNSSCQSDSGDEKERKDCGLDASMMDFLGTFLIDNQLPTSGRGL